MLVNDSSSSNQSVQRQRRHASDERLRVERAQNDAAVRESVARSVGEAPAREDVDRFRALMRAADGTRASTSKPEPRGASPQAAATPSPREPVAGSSLADRFRAMLLQSPGPLRERDAAERTPVRGDERRQDVHGDAASAAGSGAAPTEPMPTELMPTEPMPTRAVPARDGLAQEAAASKPRQKAADGEETPVRDRRTPASDAAQKPAQKAADGDSNLVAAARQAQRGTPAQEGDETSKDESSTIGAQSFVPLGATPDAPMPLPQGTGDAPQQAAATAGNTAPAIADLLEKHVKQMLVSDPRSLRGQSREVLLRMQSDVLPGTDLWLSQTRNGWQLRADVRSRDAYETLLANQEELIQRFADGDLGELTIEPVFHA